MWSREDMLRAAKKSFLSFPLHPLVSENQELDSLDSFALCNEEIDD
jgi:hypothetical protein